MGLPQEGAGVSAWPGPFSRTAPQVQTRPWLLDTGDARGPPRGREGLRAAMLMKAKEEEEPSEGEQAQRSQPREPLPKSRHGSRLE